LSGISARPDAKGLRFYLPTSGIRQQDRGDVGAALADGADSDSKAPQPCAGEPWGLQCAIAIQRALAAYNREHSDEPVKVRIGLHTGEAIRDHEDFFGKNVILASRIASLASGEEILVSSLLKALVESSGEFEFGEPRLVALRGLAGSHQVFDARWRDDGA
jgi:class 3 adenylate cyclase